MEATAGWTQALLRRGHDSGDAREVLRVGPVDLALSSPDPRAVAATAARLVVAPPSESPAPWGALAVALLEDGRGVAPPLPAAPAPEEAPIRLLGSHGSVVAYVDGERMVWVVDLQSRRAVRWAREPAAVPLWELASPLRVALHWLAAAHGGALLHAAAVAGPSGAALLVGPAGAGKSTSAMACIGSDLEVLGDDYVLLATSPRVEVSALYSAGKLDGASLALLPHLRSRVVGVGVRGKSLISIDQGRAPAPVEVRAVCAVMRGDGGGTSLQAASRAEILRRLAPSSVFQLPGATGDVLRAAATVVRAAEPLTLSVDDPREVPDVLSALLR
jgi:hypothetical protein